MSKKNSTFAKNFRVIPNPIQGERLDTDVGLIRFQTLIISK